MFRWILLGVTMMQVTMWSLVCQWHSRWQWCHGASLNMVNKWLPKVNLAMPWMLLSGELIISLKLILSPMFSMEKYLSNYSKLSFHFSLSTVFYFPSHYFWPLTICDYNFFFFFFIRWEMETLTITVGKGPRTWPLTDGPTRLTLVTPVQISPVKPPLPWLPPPLFSATLTPLIPASFSTTLTRYHSVVLPH